MARVQAVLRHFVAGRVWIPDSTSWTKPLLDEACAFPYGKNDDQVDCMTLALLYLRDIYALLVPDEQWEEPKKQKRKLYW